MHNKHSNTGLHASPYQVTRRAWTKQTHDDTLSVNTRKWLQTITLSEGHERNRYITIRSHWTQESDCEQSQYKVTKTWWWKDASSGWCRVTLRWNRCRQMLIVWWWRFYVLFIFKEVIISYTGVSQRLLQVLPIATRDAVFSLYPVWPTLWATLNDSCFLSLIVLFVL